VSDGLSYPVGSAVRVLLRPDDLAPSEHDGIETVVSAIAFRGAETLHTLRLADGTALVALLSSHQQRQPGDALRVRLDLAHVVVFPEQGAPAA
jgi:iron(III) transport system ATP-binding protein